MRKTKGKTGQNGALLLCAPLERGIKSRDLDKRRAARLDIQHFHRPAHRGLLRMRHVNGLNESPSTEQTSPTCPYNHIKEHESNRQCPRYHSHAHNVSVSIKAHLTAVPCRYTSHSDEHGEGVGGGSRGASIKESEERSSDAVFNEPCARAGGRQCLRTFTHATVLMHFVIQKTYTTTCAHHADDPSARRHPSRNCASGATDRKHIPRAWVACRGSPLRA